MQSDPSGVTSHAQKTYKPDPQREGIGLCLSGGGYRAMLYHLGACRRLNELGMLGLLKTISSVSGGSLFAGFLATRLNWAALSKGQSFSQAEWSEQLEIPVRRLAHTNIRTPALRQKLLPWNWLGPQAIALLVAEFHKHLGPPTLEQLPQHPNFVLCATDLGFGVNWTFERNRIGDYQVGYFAKPEYPLSTAAGVSSCFPPVFAAYRSPFPSSSFAEGNASEAERQHVLRDLRLNDGGNYDNLGLEPVWKTHQTVLVSDGGAVLEYAPDSGMLGRLLRYVAVMDQQGRALRKRWLISNFIEQVMSGAYWGIGSAAESYEMERPEAYSKEFAQNFIARIRTDLDAFDDREAGVLENHGYTMADVAVHKHIGDQIPQAADFRLPHPHLTDTPALRAHLKQSAQLSLWGRG